MPNRPTRHIYVIRLSKLVLGKVRFVKANPNYDGRKQCLYVGLTGREPAVRFAQHKAGYKACSYAKKFGIDLLPSLGVRTRKSHAKALRIERELADRLRAEGYAVWQR